MLRDITIGQHFPGTSLVHRFDPRMKLVLTIVYIVLLFAASNPLGLTLSILFLALMYKVAQIPFKMILKSLKKDRSYTNLRVFQKLNPQFYVNINNWGESSNR